MVRLSQQEYQNSVRDLLGLPDFETGGHITGTSVEGYVGTEAGISGQALFDAYSAEAERIAAQAVGTLPQLADAAALEDEQTVSDFLSSYGRRVLRRPLQPDDVERYLAVYRAGKTDGGAAEGVEWMLQGLFGSPEFVYRVERVPEGVDSGLEPLDAYARATRLSYFLTRQHTQRRPCSPRPARASSTRPRESATTPKRCSTASAAGRAWRSSCASGSRWRAQTPPTTPSLPASTRPTTASPSNCASRRRATSTTRAARS